MNRKIKGLSKTWKWIIGVFAVLFVLVGATALFFTLRWKPLITEKIKDAVYNGSNHLYKIDFKDLHLNLLMGSATLDSVSLMPDSAVYEKLRLKKMAPNHLMEITVKKLHISRAGILNAYFKKKLDINAIVLNKPSINMIYRKVARKADTVVNEKTLYDQISKSLKSLHIRQIRIIDADFDYINGVNKRKQNAVKHFDVTIHEFLLDSLADQDTSRFFYTKDVSFKLVGYKSLSKDRMYTIKTDTITGSALGKSIRIKGFQMIPMYPELAFTRKYKVQKDRYDINFKTILLNGVDFFQLSQEERLHAQSVSLSSARVGIFMNREFPPPPIDKGRNYPHMVLKRLSLSLHIDTLKLKNIHVAYTEFNPITQERGTIDLEQLQGTVLNVTNDSLQLRKKSHAIANLSTRIIKAAQLNVKIDFNLLSKNGAFTYSGNIGPMDMKALNPLSKSLGLVKIDQGTVQKADFNIRGNLQGSSGTMRFYYKDLKVTLLKEDDEGGPAKKKGLLSFLANTIVIIDANPSKNEAVRTANIKFERTPAASFFNLLWKSVFVGIRETVGIGVVPVKSPEKAYEKVADKKAERQEKREKRKEERQKKREERAKAAAD